VRTSNPLFDGVLARARADLRALASGDGDDAFTAAGIPWYAALFGRDSIVTSLQDLWLSPDDARRTLVLLARAQADVDDAWRDAEPGKILHEVRRGELAKVGLVPFGSYYGTADATPLWIVLFAEVFRATGDENLLRALLPNLNRALDWIDLHGDLDGDGFVEYKTRSTAGLVNHGWKDSWDGIVRADGRIPEAPIALVEVQAYVYAAKIGAAKLFRAASDEARARALEREADELRSRFETAFWMKQDGYYCLALDGHKGQVTAVTSNPGHALFCGILSSERASSVAERLMSEDLFSGWGIRTLSNREVRYNPVGYHLGTVWPHDNAIIALGLKRYALDHHVIDVVTGMFDAAQHFPTCRMPELFCGFARSAFGVPVRYPVACSPQAWAAGSWSMFLQAMLGTWPDAVRRELVIVRPTLPPWLKWVEIDGLRVGTAEVDVRYARVGRRTAADVLAMRGDVRVVFTDEWRRQS
jgi:glycogen debranching enzyme